MSYADFTYYEDEFLGTAIAEADFPRLALRASAQIDRLTFSRAAAIITADDDETQVAAIKNATCEIAEELQRQESNASVDGITSESQGQYSVSYGSNSNRSRTNQQKVEDAAKLWLETTGLMFAGFNDGEYGAQLTNDS
jgi:hypothetical protein